MNQQALRDIAKKLKILNYAKEIGNILKTYRYFGLFRETFYTWKEHKKRNDIQPPQTLC